MNDNREMKVGLTAVLAGLIVSAGVVEGGCNDSTTSTPPECVIGCGIGNGCGGCVRSCNTVGCSTTTTDTCGTCGDCSACTHTCAECSSCTTTSPSCACMPPVICQAGEETTPCTTLFVVGGGPATCAAGVRTCSADGTSYGACEGEVRPGPSACAPQVPFSCNASPAACGQATSAALLPVDGAQTALSAASTVDGGVVVATRVFTGGVVVAELDASNQVAWSFAIPGASTAFVATDGAGNTVVTGSFRGDLGLHGLNSTSDAGYALHLLPGGAIDWVRAFGIGVFLPTAVGVASNGDVVISAPVGTPPPRIDSLTPTGNIGMGAVLFLDGSTGTASGFLRVGTLPSGSTATELVGGLAVASDGAAAVAMLRGTGQCGLFDLEIALAAVGGAAQAPVLFDQPISPSVAAFDARGRLLVAGASMGTFPITNASPAGALLAVDLLAQQVVSRVELPGAPTALAVSSAGDIYVAGASSTAPFVVKLDLDMNLYFSRSPALSGQAPSGSPWAAFAGAAVVPTGVALVGNVAGTLDFGSGFASMQVSSVGQNDAFLAALQP